MDDKPTSGRDFPVDAFVGELSVVLELNEEQSAAFIDALETPRPSNEALRKLMRKKPPWESC